MTLALGTSGLQAWISGNIIPVVVLFLATIMLFAAGKGDLAKLFKIGGGVLIAFAVLGIAVKGSGAAIGVFLAGLLN